MTPTVEISREDAGATIAQLPDGWRWVRLGDICVVATGGTPSTNHPEYYGGDVRWLKSGDVKGTYILEVPNRITSLGLANSNARVHPPGSVMLALSGQGKTRGTSAILTFPCACSQSVAALLPSNEAIPEVIHFALVYFYEAIRLLTGDNERTGLNLKIVRNIKIPLPPLSEQKRIARILKEQMAAVERARRSAEAQLQTADVLPAAYLRAVFSKPEVQSWPRKPFGDLVENFDGRRVPVKLDERRNKQGSYPYYGASGIIDYVDDFLFDGEYLLIGEDGANLVLRSSPIAFKASGKFWVNNHAHVVQPKDGIPLDYLLHFFAVTDLKLYVTGAAQPKLTQGDLNSIPIPVPPPSNQGPITAQLSWHLSSAELLRQTLVEQLDAINKLPAALLRRAFSGGL